LSHTLLRDVVDDFNFEFRVERLRKADPAQKPNPPKNGKKLKIIFVKFISQALVDCFQKNES
jgi:hypothetical protein